ncbi:MAG: hypothetical protein COU27_01450 [Candidatus Levybacteria bacterium CG10_big_fil_rev_8_21_14_0_10_36_7]|nr:MAG: hypothetical protein COU27_01450 [Candidatus Levybacteria bacterium CG10_big_fil_rev_8_21_14_0_10_36_7]
MEENNNPLEQVVTAKNKFFLFEKKHQIITLFALFITLAGFISIINQIKYAQQFSSNAQTPVTYTSTPSPTSSASATLTPAPTSTPSGTITKVTFPNGGETLYKGRAYTIKWDFSTNQKNIAYPLSTTILLKNTSQNPNATVFTILKNSLVTKSGSNSAEWTISPLVPTKENYKISIQIEKSFAGIYPKDESDKNFTVTNNKTASISPTIAYKKRPLPTLKPFKPVYTDKPAIQTKTTESLNPILKIFSPIVNFFSKLF